MFVVHVYHASMTFTCIKVLSGLVVKGGLHVWNMNRWDKQQAAGWAKTNKVDTRYERVRKGHSLMWGRGQDGHIPEVLQGIAAQVCINVYRSYNVRDSLEKKKRLKIQYVVYMTDCSFFRRLKINHVSHEFILEFGTVAYTKNIQTFVIPSFGL